MYCLFCGHSTPEGELYCDETCENNHATEDALADIDSTDYEPDDLDDEACREIDDIPDDETLVYLICH